MFVRCQNLFIFQPIFWKEANLFPLSLINVKFVDKKKKTISKIKIIGLDFRSGTECDEWNKSFVNERNYWQKPKVIFQIKQYFDKCFVFWVNGLIRELNLKSLGKGLRTIGGGGSIILKILKILKIISLNF